LLAEPSRIAVWPKLIVISEPALALGGTLVEAALISAVSSEDRLPSLTEIKLALA
jgi:hypothetical protein